MAKNRAGWYLLAALKNLSGRRYAIHAEYSRHALETAVVATPSLAHALHGQRESSGPAAEA